LGPLEKRPEEPESKDPAEDSDYGVRARRSKSAHMAVRPEIVPKMLVGCTWT